MPMGEEWGGAGGMRVGGRFTSDCIILLYYLDFKSPACITY